MLARGDGVINTTELLPLSLGEFVTTPTNGRAIAPSPRDLCPALSGTKEEPSLTYLEIRNSLGKADGASVLAEVSPYLVQLSQPVTP